MASNLRVDSIVPATGSSVSIGTATGGVNIPGVLTYEDVTNVDSVGVITARSGIRLGATGANTLITGNATGIGIGTDTPAGKLEIDAASTTEMIMLDVSGTNFAKIGHNSSGGVAVLDVRSEGHTRFLTNGNNERIRLGTAGQIGIAGANYGTSGQVLTSQGASSAVQWATPSSVTTTSGTMTVGFRDHVANAVSSTTATGYYERIGNMVFCSVDTGAINLSGLNNSQILLLTGCFPITRHANWVMNGVATPVTINSGQNSGGPVIVPRYGYWLSNTSLHFSIPRNNSSADNMTIGMMNSGNSRIYLQYSYKVA